MPCAQGEISLDFPFRIQYNTKMFKYFYTLLFVFLASCGPTNKDITSVPDTTPPEIVNLKVGDDFMVAPHTEVKFIGLVKDEPRIKYLSFKAPFKGQLTISKMSHGLAYNCEGRKQEVQYTTDYFFHLKDPKTELYSISIEPQNTDIKEILPSILMEQNQEVRITIQAVSDSNCSQILMFLTAVYETRNW